MKVKELKNILNEFNDEDIVILQKDSEGNGYSPLSGYDEMTYVAENTWSGDVYIKELTSEHKEFGYTEEDLYDGDDGVNAIILFPVN